LILLVHDGADPGNKNAGFSANVDENSGFWADFGVPGAEGADFLAEKPKILIWNKRDIAPCPENSGFLAVSAKTGEGIPALMSKIQSSLEEIYQKPAAPRPGIGTERQKELIEGALQALKKALELSAAGEALDIIAIFLREAVENLGAITGEVSTDDILEAMFSRFCVGK